MAKQKAGNKIDTPLNTQIRHVFHFSNVLNLACEIKIACTWFTITGFWWEITIVLLGTPSKYTFEWYLPFCFRSRTKGR